MPPHRGALASLGPGYSLSLHCRHVEIGVEDTGKPKLPQPIWATNPLATTEDAAASCLQGSGDLALALFKVVHRPDH